MNKVIISTHLGLLPILGQLKEHSSLVNQAGLSSEQASEIVFHPLRATNERDFMEMRELTMWSDCCRAKAQVNTNGDIYCASCGEYCQTI